MTAHEPADRPEPRPPGQWRALPPELLSGTDIVVVDVETTGLRAECARITEVAAVRLSRRGAAPETAEFSALVNPGMPIPPDVAALTGISDSLVSGAPPIARVLPAFLSFAATSVIAAHNAPFDVGFLVAACRRAGIPWPPRAVIDTVVLAKIVLWPDEVPDHKLTTLADHFAVATRPVHRALADARAAAEVMTCLLAMLEAGATRVRGHSPGAAGRRPGYRTSDRPGNIGHRTVTMADQQGIGV